MDNILQRWYANYQKRVEVKRAYIQEQKVKAAQYRKDQNDICKEVTARIKDHFDWRKLRKKENGYVYNRNIKVNRNVITDEDGCSWIWYELIVDQDAIHADDLHIASLYAYLRQQYEDNEQNRITDTVDALLIR